MLRDRPLYNPALLLVQYACGSVIRRLAVFIFSGSGNWIPLPFQIQPRSSPGSHVPYVVHVKKKANGSGIGGSFGRVFESPNPIGVFLLPSLALRASLALVCPC